MRTHSEALGQIEARPLFDVVQVTCRIGSKLGKRIYPASPIIIEEVSDDGGIAAQVKMTYNGVRVMHDSSWPTLAQVIAFVLDNHW